MLVLIQNIPPVSDNYRWFNPIMNLADSVPWGLEKQKLLLWCMFRVTCQLSCREIRHLCYLFVGPLRNLLSCVKIKSEGRSYL